MFKKLIIGIIVTLMSASVFAADSIGMVVASKGSTVSNDVTALKQGSSVFINDVITTSAQSFVIIQLNDGTKLTVRPSSTLIIDEYSYQSLGEDKMKVNLVEGGLRIITGAIAKTSPENYLLETPVALMGVRGTEFSIMLCDGKIC